MQSGIERWCSGTLIILINNGIRYLGNRISSLLHEGNFAKFCEYYQMEKNKNARIFFITISNFKSFFKGDRNFGLINVSIIDRSRSKFLKNLRSQAEIYSVSFCS